IQELLPGAMDVMSLAQGVVYWQPPESAMAKVEKIIREPTLSKYGSDDGLPELREALLEKPSDRKHMESVGEEMEQRRRELRLFANTADTVDAAVVRPGHLDMHIQFTLCDFEAFKALTSNYLGLKDHKLYSQVEEGFHTVAARISPAGLGEIMLANRASPSRASPQLDHQAPAYLELMPAIINASEVQMSNSDGLTLVRQFNSYRQKRHHGASVRQNTRTSSFSIPPHGGALEANGDAKDNVPNRWFRPEIDAPCPRSPPTLSRIPDLGAGYERLHALLQQRE
ncbi:hypothetical protein ACJX0J_036861, partial [Zea mays]